MASRAARGLLLANDGRHRVVANVASRVLCCALLVACGTGDNRVDPGDLEPRDLLGIAPEVARSWDATQRASARRVLDDELRKSDVSIMDSPPAAKPDASTQRPKQEKPTPRAKARELLDNAWTMAPKWSRQPIHKSTPPG